MGLPVVADGANKNSGKTVVCFLKSLGSSPNSPVQSDSGSALVAAAAAGAVVVLGASGAGCRGACCGVMPALDCLNRLSRSPLLVRGLSVWAQREWTNSASCGRTRKTNSATPDLKPWKNNPSLERTTSSEGVLVWRPRVSLMPLSS